MRRRDMPLETMKASGDTALVSQSAVVGWLPAGHTKSDGLSQHGRNCAPPMITGLTIIWNSSTAAGDKTTPTELPVHVLDCVYRPASGTIAVRVVLEIGQHYRRRSAVS